MSDRRAVDGVVTRPARLSDEARGALWLLVLTVLGVGLAFAAVALQRQAQGTAGALFWLALGAGLTAAVVGMSRLSLLTPDREPDAGSAALMGTLQRYAPVATVPFVLLLAWEGLVVGFRVPPGIFPSVAGIGQALVRTWPVLMADAYPTVVRVVLFGFVLRLVPGLYTGSEHYLRDFQCR